MLDVKLLHPCAKAPTVAHSGEDLGYDLYACEGFILHQGGTVKVRTGVAVEAYGARLVPSALQPGRMIPQRTPLGLLIRDRSSMASKGVIVSGGVVDAGYRGEVIVLMTNIQNVDPVCIQSGDKIAQMVPIQVLTGEVKVVEELTELARGENGFGSTGK